MEKIKTFFIVCIYIVISTYSCSRGKGESLDDRLTLKRSDYHGKELRINGYYCRYRYVNNNSEPQGITPYFLYRNGVLLGDVGVNIDRISEMEEWFRNGNYAKIAKKYYWGVFQIEKTQIKYEKWLPVQGPLIAVTYEGVILNDTTFVISETYEMKNGQKIKPEKIHWEYHFKQFSPKPDSTNRFIP